MGKVFSQEHYEQDDWAKYQIIEWLQGKGYTVDVNPDKFGIDLLGSRWGKTFNFEIEVKHNWHDQTFPFDYIHFSARKRKFVSLDAETWFVMLNHERTYALFVNGEDFLKSPIVMKDTKYSVNEAFVEVDVHWAIFRDLKEEAV